MDLLIFIALVLFGVFGWLFAALAFALSPAWAWIVSRLSKKPLMFSFDVNNRLRYIVPKRENSRGLILKDKRGYIKTPNSAYYDGKTRIFLVQEEVAATIPHDAVVALQEAEEELGGSPDMKTEKGVAQAWAAVRKAINKTLRPKVVYDFFSNLAPEHIKTIISAELEAEKRMLGFEWKWLIFVGVFVLLVALAWQMLSGGVDYGQISQAVAEGVAKGLKQVAPPPASPDTNATQVITTG